MSACSSSSNADSDGGACPVATGCPTSAPPTYTADIAPILDRVCLTCHAPGGPGGVDFSTYAKVFANRSAILDQVNACIMPPSNGPALSAGDRIALTGWLECGAPND